MAEIANITHIAAMENFAGQVWKNPVVFGLRRLFYLCSPSETSFQFLEHVPDIVGLATPYFFAMITVEGVILTFQGRRHKMRLNDAFSSLAAGMISILPLMVFRNIELSAYLWVFKNYRLMEMPWNSPLTWTLAMLGVDLGYYWVHRCAHEFNFMWAAHQVHHSSEDYNLTTALRQSVLQRYTSWVFYLPLAFFIPPAVFVTHLQLNLIYQFWIHTELVSNLGPLELVLNTPSHHRVHHGRNKYCIDKNYAGVLIIWDRIFGTFAPEQERGKIAYGLIHPLSSWDPVYTQLHQWKRIFRQWRKMKTWRKKLSVVFNGPGWFPGKPRLGAFEDLPNIQAPVTKYDKSQSSLMTCYSWLHFALAFGAHQYLQIRKRDLSSTSMLGGIGFLMWTVSNIGFFYERKPYAAMSEVLRCSTFLASDAYLSGGATCLTWHYPLRAVFVASAALSAISAIRSGAAAEEKKRN